jgi:hypothetical protein
MVGGFVTSKNGEWILENLTDKDHIRGALKAYRKETFNKWGVKSTNGIPLMNYCVNFIIGSNN